MKNLFKLGAWFCGIVSALLLIMGFTGILTHHKLFGVWGSTYYYLSSNVILFGILLLLFYLVSKDKKD
jgi:hypothetical protein